MVAETAVETQGQRAKPRVFISYSRKDMSFADLVEAALRARGFDPLIDRSEIFAFEEWWKRIETLIVKADTIVFVLSPDAVTSEVCQKEVEFAASLNKRFAPIVVRPVDSNLVPKSLAQLNFMFFTDDARFEESADRLSEALLTDIVWIRRHTDFGEQARRWLQAGRPGGLLLRSPVLEEAERWIAARPNASPSPTEDTLSFISESRRAATRRRNMLTSSLGAGLVVAIALAGLTFWQRGVAVEQQRLAVERRDTALIAQSRLLTDRAIGVAASGDVVTGMLLALAALPDERGGIKRPYVPAAELALFNSGLLRWESALLKGHEDSVLGAAFSPDGKRVATASSDGTARIWDAMTGTRLVTLKGHDSKVWSICFSPDGRRVITGSQDKTARIWDAATGAQIAMLNHTDWVTSATFSPDGKRVATASSHAGARIWDAETAAPIIAFARDVAVITSIAFSPDGKRLATASDYGKTAQVWDAKTGTRIAELIGHDDEVNSAAFSPDGMYVLTASSDGTARIWDAKTGTQIVALKGHKGPVTSSAFSPDGRRAVTSSDDGTARVWNAVTGAQIAVIAGHTDGVTSAAFSPDGRKVVTGSKDATARIWDAAPKMQEVTIDRKYGNAADLYVLSPDWRRIAKIPSAIVAPITLQILDIPTGVRVNLPHDGWIKSANFSPDGARVMSITLNRTMRIWDVATGAQIAEYKGKGEPVISAAFSPDGRRVAATSSGKTVIWDTSTGVEIGLDGLDSWVKSTMFSPNGDRVVTASDDPIARIWDASTGVLITPLRGHESGVESAVFSADGRRVATASTDGTARIWDTATGTQIAVLKHDTWPYSATFSADGQRIATFSNEATLLWDITAAAPVAMFKGPDAKPHVLSRDGRRMATLVAESGNLLMRIWRVFPTTQDIVEETKQVVPRCLTQKQRSEASLDLAPPAWCIEMEKWPYHTQDWRDWLRYGRAGEKPPLPDSPSWHEWVAAHMTKASWTR